jgi:acyl carrier protein
LARLGSTSLEEFSLPGEFHVCPDVDQSRTGSWPVEAATNPAATFPFTPCNPIELRFADLVPHRQFVNGIRVFVNKGLLADLSHIASKVFRTKDHESWPFNCLGNDIQPIVMNTINLAEDRGGREDVTLDVRAFVLKSFPLARKQQIKNSDPLLDSGMIDSQGILEVVAFIEQEFSVIVVDEELSPENFESIDRIAAFIRNKKQQ